MKRAQKNPLSHYRSNENDYSIPDDFHNLLNTLVDKIPAQLCLGMNKRIHSH
jgi:hypothetical protein